MKIILLLSVLALCFCSNSVTQDKQQAAVSDKLKVEIYENGKLLGYDIYEKGVMRQSTFYNANFEPKESITKYSYNEKGEYSKVDLYEDGKLAYSRIYEKGLLKQSTVYNTKLNTEETIAKYHHYENGQYERTEIIKGSDPGLDRALEDDHYERESRSDIQFLKSKNIEFPFPDLIGNEIRDLSDVVSVADNYEDFKKELTEKDNIRTLKFVGFNKNIRFKPSQITLYLGDNEIIKDYELILKDSYPQKETYATSAGELVKEYFYEDNRLIRLLYKFTGTEGVATSEKKFVYTRLDGSIP
jgi:hypothetical protein